MELIYPGIWRIRLGEPESQTPVALRQKPPAEAGLKALPPVSESPLPGAGVVGRKTSRGYVVTIDLEPQEQLYGFGLQLKSFNQRGLKKTLRVNSDPVADTGDSHAPVPFYVSTRGYGVLVDTARYATFYTGALRQMERGAQHEAVLSEEYVPETAFDLYGYAQKKLGATNKVFAEIPAAAGADVYVFAGPDLLSAVQRYVLFSGGGAMPSRWGLGVWYRGRSNFTQDDVVACARGLRADGIPCDVFGLEPGWQSYSYSCSYMWGDKFPDPRRMLREMTTEHYRVNCWTHAFIHPSSPIHGQMVPYSGDFEVWKGLVPDLTMPEARRIFADHHEKEHVELGVSGYKMDECDNSDFIKARPWSFPEIAEFPSGLDGEQMHSLLGNFYQGTLDTIFRKRNTRTYGAVRAAHALAAPYPYVLYSDLYDHRDFIRGLVGSGFSGLLWTPEVRDAKSPEDLIRRLQSTVLSPQALINAWYIKNPPWKQWVRALNNKDEWAEGYQEIEAACRSVLELRMKLIPYLYAAFSRYHQEGLPPFRGLVMDYPDDPNVWNLDDQFMIGDRLMAAPVVAGVYSRSVYLPAGAWYDWWTGQRYGGGQTITIDVPLDRVPLFVKDGSLLPLAQVTLHTEDPASFSLTVQVYGDGSLPITLYEDDGTTYNYELGECNTLTLTWNGTGAAARKGSAACPGYRIAEWQRIQG